MNDYVEFLSDFIVEALLYSFLLGHYFVDVMMVFLITNALFHFPCAVHLLLTMLVSSQYQYCFQYVCCHVAAV